MTNKKRKGSQTHQKTQRHYKQHLKRKARAEKLRLKRREEQRNRLAATNPEIHIAELNCKTKKSFPDKLSALKCKARNLFVYECPFCFGWHYTSKDPEEDQYE